MATYIGDLLSSNPDLLAKFRAQVTDVLPELKSDFHRSDLCLFTYLAARDCNLRKAEEFLRKHLEWRKMNQIDRILDVRVPAEVLRDIRVSVTGLDRRGCPVVYYPLGKWKTTPLIRKGLQANIQTMVRQCAERFMEINAELSKDPSRPPTCQYFEIYDFKGFDYSQLLSRPYTKLLQDILGDCRDNYPETACYVHIINASKLFRLLFAIVKPVMTGRMLQRTTIHGTDEDQWKPKLLQQMQSADDLPSCCGGSLTTWFQDILETGVRGLAVPKKIESLPDEEFSQVLLPALGSHRIDLGISDKGKSLVWNFKTDDSAIEFEVLWEGKVVIVEIEKVDSHRFVQKGLVQCKEPGTYSLIFHNEEDDDEYNKGQNLFVATRVI